MARFLDAPNVKLLQIDNETADCYAAIYASLRTNGDPVPTNDLWIAASAMQYGLHIVTANLYFRLIPQVLTDWFEV